MLRVTTIKAGGDSIARVVEYYESLARQPAKAGSAGRGPIDYYVDENEPPGLWWGRGAEAVGLGGEVEAEQLGRMLVAHHPFTAERVGRGFGERSARAFDATFSAPKSVSVLWALAEDPWTRAEVAAAHDDAVTSALSWIERHGALTRRGRDGVDQVPTRGLTVALFRQHTSRAADPQLHTHAIVWSKVQNAGGTWLALDARFLKYQQRSAGYVYQAALRAELISRLGVSWEPVADSDIPEIAGIPEGLRECFSARAVQVEARFREYVRTWVADHDGADPSPATLYRLERLAAEHSRPGKGTVRAPEELRAAWAGRARDAGFGPVSVPVSVPDPSRGNPVDEEALVSEALARVAQRSSTWLRADLAREIAILLPADGAGNGTAVVTLVDHLAEQAASRCVELYPGVVPGREPGSGVHVTDRRLSSRAVLDQEARLLGWARSAVGAGHLDPEPPWSLSGAQAAAGGAVSGSAGLVLVSGPAGAGKTTALRTAVEQLAGQGRAVLGLAPSGKAADVLAAEAGCPAMTLAKLLEPRTDLPPAGTTVILDEAGMASSEDLDRLVGLVRAQGWRLVAVGDGFQLPAVGRGGMFGYWCATLPTIGLDQVRRFENAWEADASLRLRAGDESVAEVYARHGRVKGAHPAMAAERVARRHHALTAEGGSVAITTASAEVARDINRAIQHELGHWRSGVGVRLHDGTEVFAGDTVATRHNDRRLVASQGASVRNRQTWTVEEVRPDGGLVVRHPKRGEVVLPVSHASRHVELGWAVTGYGNQGVTVDHGICVIEPTTSRAGAYVGMTRGRRTNTAFVLDRSGVADPAEALAGVIRRPANGVTAHATRDKLRGQPVIEPRPVDETDPAQRLAARLNHLQCQPPPSRRPVSR
ncbi:MAG TPA: MobF family relaxase [Acidimicrobiales bacterium]|nr:MobF family relaxase [Acidimicrobiales bacterium]